MERGGSVAKLEDDGTGQPAAQGAVLDWTMGSGLAFDMGKGEASQEPEVNVMGKGRHRLVDDIAFCAGSQWTVDHVGIEDDPLLERPQVCQSSLAGPAPQSRQENSLLGSEHTLVYGQRARCREGASQTSPAANKLTSRMPLMSASATTYFRSLLPSSSVLERL
jgi:hypothetical protein